MKRNAPVIEYLALLSGKNLILENDLSTTDAGKITVSLVTCDSREVIPGSVFICKGAHFNESYLITAAEKGAVLYLSEKRYSAGIPALIVSDVRLAMALLADFFYGHPSGKVRLTGITGTKGKSSTAYMLRSILDAYDSSTIGRRSGLISTIDTYDGIREFKSHLTTPEPLELEGDLSNCADSGLRHVTMEVSSQALKYNRVTNVEFETGVFLNIGRDHISPVEHPDFEDYFFSKLKLFSQSRNAVVNLDSDHADEILAAAEKNSCRIITFSLKDRAADLFADDIKAENSGNTFRLTLSEKMTGLYAEALSREKDAGGQEEMNTDFLSMAKELAGTAVHVSLPGRFNVENALASISVSVLYGVPASCIRSALAEVSVPGRMEVFESRDRKITAVVDYAHNQLSFRNLFRTVREEYPDRTVVAVFGCSGGKAYERRVQLPTVAAEYSDMIYVTEDDPGDEPVSKICSEIAATLDRLGAPYEIIEDRAEAVKAALSYDRKPLVAVIAGKGRDAFQKRGTEFVPFPSDADYAIEFLKAYDKAGSDR
ncbi:MAG: UDP-N-acetylmuramoyl-L-alanyl-D-glutamate--2,6-diaminopimelate ligase [Eubacterium sp.]|nr:UDP-N-acetylmuramoyl-L-alanyl-D-glutamate--2,6-diaminopimelate ligase [Eubacterium sp.]